MADVLTNRLRATKPDVGGSDDTWGSKLNTDWDIVDRVYRDLAGALVSSTFGSANAHEVTLTHSDYADIDSTLGFRIALRSGATNTGAMTLDVGDANGPRPVRKGAYGATDVFSMQELAAGDFPEHHVGDFIYIRRTGFSGWVMTNPARGGIPNATTTVRGIVELATDDEAEAKTDATKAVTPKNLAAMAQEIIPDASMTVKGKVELATPAEVQTGTDAVRAVTPSGLVDASTTARGLVELATAAEVQTGTDAVRAVTPSSLVDSSTTARGLVELATGAEAIAGTDATRAVTPVALEAALDDHAPTANAGRVGLIETATDDEALAGTDGLKAITPATLAYEAANRTSRANQLVQHSNLVVTRTGADTVHIVAMFVLLQRTGDAAPRRFSTIVETANINTLGAGGRDAGAINNDAWYAIHIIAKEDGTASSLLTLADGGTGATGGAPGANPTLPSGYVYWGYVGSVRRSGGSFVNFVQCGNVASITGPALTVSVADNEWHAVSGFSTYVPPEALSVRVNVVATGTTAVLAVLLAPTATPNTTATGSFGEVLIQGTGTKLTGQATLGITTKQTIYARTANSGAGVPISDVNLYVNGYTL